MIKNILTEIASESSTNKKMDILKKYANNETLKSVLYLAESKRIKFYLKQIPQHAPHIGTLSLESALSELTHIYNRNVTGGEASKFLADILTSLSEDDAYVIERIIEKDPKIGMGSTNINKILGKNFIEKTPYMGAVAYNETIARDIVASKGGSVSQIKMDGRYCNALIDGGMVRLESRGGEPSYLQGSKFLSELRGFDTSIVLNGELTMDGITRYESNGIIASCISIGKKFIDGEDISKEVQKFQEKHNMSHQEALDKIVFTVWDCITPDEYAANKSDIPYSRRFENVNTILTEYNPTMIRLIESVHVSTYSDAVNHFLKCLNSGEEGTILKSLDGGWKDGKPKWQCKMKKVDFYDLKIVGFNYGTPGSKNENLISSLNVETEDGLLKTSPGGISDKDMIFITENQESLLGKIVEVKCSGLSKDSSGNYSLLHPVFNKIRNDKDIANTLEECIKIDKMINSL